MKDYQNAAPDYRGLEVNGMQSRGNSNIGLKIAVAILATFLSLFVLVGGIAYALSMSGNSNTPPSDQKPIEQSENQPASGIRSLPSVIVRPLVKLTEEVTSQAAEKECHQCDGSGKIYDKCSDCGGSGTISNICPTCGGNGTVLLTCSDCGGAGGPCSNCGGWGCPACGGTGACPSCSGSGQIQNNCGQCSGTGSVDDQCGTCGGGKWIEDTCPACGGTGKPASQQ